ncbi:hypothetical protein CRE_25248 [Caenorhabditis remanei]|uniref:Uncharacterized protein n=1 Tax=Caenorhabditis remanei TaxID=31234 RepID=E3LS51_CAERE|nr:hypothetical protein CRE_25248 [Caenorhabditis remanei]
MRQMSPHLPQQNPELEGIFKKVLCKASLLLLEKSGVKTVDAFQKCFGPLIEEMEREKVVEKEVIEVQRDGAVSPISFEEFQNNPKIGWSELLEEPFTSSSAYNYRRRTSLFSDLNLLSPIASEASKSPEKLKRSQMTPARSINKKPFFNSMSTPKTPWRRGNSMYVEDSLNKTMIVTPRKSVSATRLAYPSPSPLPDETPLENRASRLRRMKIDEKLREESLGWK